MAKKIPTMLALRFTSSVALACAAGAALPMSGSAQQFQEGISGTVDAKRRSPVVGFSTVRAPEGVKILVDAYLPNGDYEQYPIRFDIYVNRHLLVSQIRSRELPGPVGVTVPPTVATPPFNFSIVSTLLHPNRQFSSVAQGAIYPVDLSGTFSCKITVASDEGTRTFEASEAKATQPAPNRMTLTLPKPLSGDSAEDQSFSIDLEVTGTSTSGTIVDAAGSSSPVTGTITLDQAGNQIQALTAAGTDSLPSLQCTALGTSASTDGQTEALAGGDFTTEDDDPSLTDDVAEQPATEGASSAAPSEAVTLSSRSRPSSAEEIVDALLGTAGR